MFAFLEGRALESERHEPEMAITAAVLEERVNGHIKFVWALMSGGFAWLAGISFVLFQMNGTMNRVEKAQVDAPARIIAGLLKRTPPTRNEMADALGAASTILRTSRFGKLKPSPAVLKDLSSEIQNAQEKYPDLPSVWQTTGQFINYKSAALLPARAEEALASAGRVLDCRSGGIRFSQGRAIVEKCTLDLEGSIQADDVLFVNCIIRYKGGAIGLKHMQFINCLFQFEVTTVPPKEAITAMIQLAASDLQNTRVTIS